MRVYLAVGHGRRDNGLFDPGAVGGGWNEQTAGDPIVAEAARTLTAAGFDVLQEAYRDDPNFRGTVRAANAWGADVLVSVHHDWVGAPVGAFGHWVSPAGREVADAIQAAVGAAGFPLRPSWHKRRTDLYLLNRSNMPTCLYEAGRIGQDELDTEEELRAMGRAIAAGIADWAGAPLDDEELDVDEILAKLDAIDRKLGDQDTRPSIWRATDRTKNAAGRMEVALAELPGRVAAAVAEVLDGRTGTTAVLDPGVVADEVVAAIREVWS